MANEFKERSIKYLGKDFQGIKRALVDYTRAHHSGSFEDFNETSPGMALLDLVAYVGDILSFYQDFQFEEIKGENARQLENVQTFAKVRGYRPVGKRAARVIETVVIEVPAVNRGGEVIPDETFIPILRAGSSLTGPGGIVFETLTPVYFSASLPTENTESPLIVTGSRIDSGTGLPSHFALRKDVELIAGETVTENISLGDFEQFRKVTLSREDVIEVLSVVDSDGNDWLEVNNLSEDVIFDAVQNDESDFELVPYVLKLRSVPRRFVVDRDIVSQRTSLIFGSGDGISLDDEIIPRVADFAIPTSGRTTLNSFSLDPQNFLKTRTLGLSPFNTTLTISYRVGGGPQTNVPAKSIRSFKDALLDFTVTGLNSQKKADVIQSVECINKQRSRGGAAAETVEEIKANAAAFFAAQERVVTREDFLARIFSMPAKFGKIEKAFVRKNSVSSNSLDIHILTKDQDGNLAQATSTLVSNVKKYLSKYRMFTDGINILQTDIINVGIDFGIVVGSKYTRDEVLAKCLSTLQDYFDIDKIQIGQPFSISDVNRVIQEIAGVVSVYDLRFKNIFGTTNGFDYSTVRYDMQGATRNGIIYCPKNAIFEIKFPRKNISGESK